MKKKGFTLAEVLITLAIIGVVAALTIPTVVQKYQQKQFYTAFMKAYNTLETAYQLSVADNGDIKNWTKLGESDIHTEAEFKKYFGDYLRVAKYCTGDASLCGVNENINIKPLNYSGSLSEDDGDLSYSGMINDSDTPASLILQDGTLIMVTAFDYENGEIELFLLFFDTNGIKGPNVIGRDIFITRLETVNNRTFFDFGQDYGLDYIINSDDAMNNCTTSKVSVGQRCGARLLLEGKMDY